MNAAAPKAVFLSYASQDAEAALRLCSGLRAAGIEVWFDADGGLEHGDEWDAKIRRQIKECVLFIPVISANTQSREEGYFRLEWDLAAERARTIANGVAFILPVVVDDTREPDALVPDRFRMVQWTRLRGGEVPPDLQQRFLKLWSHRTGVLKQHAALAANAGNAASAEPSGSQTNDARPRLLRRGHRRLALAAVALTVAGLAALFLSRRARPAASPSAAVAAGAAASERSPDAAASSSAVQALTAKARALFEAIDGSRDDFKLAEDLLTQAQAKDPTNAEVYATKAQLDERFIRRGWDSSDARREAARVALQRALRLDPQSFEARVAQAALLDTTGAEGEEKVRLLRVLRTERPREQRVLRMLAYVLERLDRVDEGAAIADESARLPGGDPLALYDKSQAYWFAGRTAEAESAIKACIAQQPFTGALLMQVWYQATLHGDLDGARATLGRVAPAQLLEDRAAYFAYYVEMLARRPDAAIARLAAVPREWLADFWFTGPKALLVGNAYEIAARSAAAEVEWHTALKLVDQMLATRPNDQLLIYRRVELLAKLGQRAEAERQFALLLQLGGVDLNAGAQAPSWAIFGCVLLGRNADAVRQLRLLIADRRSPSVTATVLRLDPRFDPLRGDPAFTQLVDEMTAKETASATAAAGERSMWPPTHPDDAKSVAVLAFENLSDDKTNEYFSDGISEELLNVLAKVPGLKVTSLTRGGGHPPRNRRRAMDGFADARGGAGDRRAAGGGARIAAGR